MWGFRFSKISAILFLRLMMMMLFWGSNMLGVGGIMYISQEDDDIMMHPIRMCHAFYADASEWMGRWFRGEERRRVAVLRNVLSATCGVWEMNKSDAASQIIMMINLSYDMMFIKNNEVNGKSLFYNSFYWFLIEIYIFSDHMWLGYDSVGWCYVMMMWCDDDVMWFEIWIEWDFKRIMRWW